MVYLLDMIRPLRWNRNQFQSWSVVVVWSDSIEPGLIDKWGMAGEHELEQKRCEGSLIVFFLARFRCTQQRIIGTAEEVRPVGRIRAREYASVGGSLGPS